MKVGDVVKVIMVDNSIQKATRDVGEYGTVVAIDSWFDFPIEVRFENSDSHGGNNECFKECELELIK